MRFIKLLLGDMRFQIKYGFYFLYVTFSVVYIMLLLVFPEAWREKAASVMIYSDPAALGLFFMGAIVLLEKSERVLNALAVSPVTTIEYILSKVLSLAVISVLVSLVLAVVADSNNIPMLLLSVALTSGIFTLLGLIVATRISSLNGYLMATVPVEIICFVPPLIYLFYPADILRFYPLSSSMALITGSTHGAGYDIAILALVFTLLLVLAYGSTEKMWKRLGGVKL
ncbi:fluoroquinolone transport system permease protein [Aequitasia blattaphilus]|uniref:ABC transporter permease n=1 Tax=Aequitasia blattaphilus TaxID=2949332 RepID=A0ABT1ED09_9FIRM|nr:ABC transporter permease [Aequitasia blattaphilus]MCP1103718.1 ABC transporter permease [Aequitasia blattaphilus]MCR8616358.1 ABC transporter permease [Aequitasia blattaphilus]